MPDFLVKLVSVGITLANMGFVGYCIFRYGQYISPPRGKLDRRCGRGHRFVTYSAMAAQGMVFLWFLEYMPGFSKESDSTQVGLSSYGLSVLVLFFAVWIASQLSDRDFDPPRQDWQRMLESDLTQAHENGDESEITRLTGISLRMILEESLGEGHAWTLTNNLSASDHAKDELFDAFNTAWNESNTDKFLYAKMRVNDLSLPLLLKLEEERKETIQAFQRRFG